MPAAAVAVSGRARVVSSWLNLVERLVFGAGDQLAAAWHPSQRPGAGGVDPRLGRAVRGPSPAAPTVTAETPVASLAFSPSEDMGNANLQPSQSPRVRGCRWPSARGGEGGKDA